MDTPSLDLDFSGIPKVACGSLSRVQTQPTDNHIDSYNEESGLEMQYSTQRREATIESKEISSILNLPSKDEERMLLDIKDFPLNENFCSSRLSEPRSALHLEAIKRHRNLLSKPWVKQLKYCIHALRSCLKNLFPFREDSCFKDRLEIILQEISSSLISFSLENCDSRKFLFDITSSSIRGSCCPHMHCIVS